MIKPMPALPQYDDLLWPTLEAVTIDPETLRSI